MKPSRKLVKNLATGAIHVTDEYNTRGWTACGTYSLNLGSVRDVSITCKKCLKMLEREKQDDGSKYFVVLVWGDVEPSLSEPFGTVELRDEEAKKLKEKYGDEHGIYWLNIDENGSPKIGAYANIFFEDEPIPYM